MLRAAAGVFAARLSAHRRRLAPERGQSRLRAERGRLEGRLHLRRRPEPDHAQRPALGAHARVARNQPGHDVVHGDVRSRTRQRDGPGGGVCSFRSGFVFRLLTRRRAFLEREENSRLHERGERARLARARRALPHGQRARQRAAYGGALAVVQRRRARPVHGAPHRARGVLARPRRRRRRQRGDAGARVAHGLRVAVRDAYGRPLQRRVRGGAAARAGARLGVVAGHAPALRERRKRGERAVVRHGVGGEVQPELPGAEHERLVLLVHGDLQEVHGALHHHAGHGGFARGVVLVALHQGHHVALPEPVERELGAEREGAFRKFSFARFCFFRVEAFAFVRGARDGRRRRRERASARNEHADHRVALQGPVVQAPEPEQRVPLLPEALLRPRLEPLLGARHLLLQLQPQRLRVLLPVRGEPQTQGRARGPALARPGGPATGPAAFRGLGTLGTSAPGAETGGAAVSSRCANPVPARVRAQLFQSARRSSRFSRVPRAAGESNGPPRRSANGVPVATALTLARARAPRGHAGARIGRRLRVLPVRASPDLDPGLWIGCRASRPARAPSRGRRPARRRACAGDRADAAVARGSRPPPWAPTRASAAVGTPTSRPHRAGAKTRSPMRTARNRRGTSWPSDRRDGTPFRSGRDVPATVVRADLWCASLPDRNHRFCQLSFLPRFQTASCLPKANVLQLRKHLTAERVFRFFRFSESSTRARRTPRVAREETPSHPSARAVLRSSRVGCPARRRARDIVVASRVERALVGGEA